MLKFFRRFSLVEMVRFFAHLPSFAKLFLGLLKDPRVAWYAKFMLVGATIYAVTPLNFANFIPVLGEVDDLMIVAIACRLFIYWCPSNVVDEHLLRIDPRGRFAPFGYRPVREVVVEGPAALPRS